MNRPLKIKLHILSPVHIGCDDVYEPTSFVIDENRRKLIEFDRFNFITALTPQEKKEFESICLGDDLLKIFKFIKRAYKNQVGGRSINIASGLVAHYRKNILDRSNYDKKEVINKFTLHRTAYNTQSNISFVPGSSIKGSLRTAYLNKLSKLQPISGFRGKCSELEKILLKGTFDKDPFRIVKTSDFLPVGEVETKIVYGINKKKEPGRYEARGPFQIFEVIKEGSIFQGSLSIQKPENGSDIKKPITAKELLSACNDFYLKLIKEENTIYNKISTSHCAIKTLKCHFNAQLGKSSFLLRIGKHSGAESVTIEGHRNIKIMQGKNKKPKFLNHSTTVWLASEYSNPRTNENLMPFGWAVLEVLNSGDIK